MDFSLILTSHDRPEDLLRFFHALSEQRFLGSVEIIFVNQGSPLSYSLPNMPDSFEMHYIEVGHRLPLSEARNLALKKATGNIIGFPDDDCWYESNLLKSIHHIFEEQLKVQCVCTNVFDPIRGLPYGNRPVNVRIPITFANIFSLPISVGIFIRQNAFKAIGARFDEFLGAGTFFGSGEETELIARLLESGANILYTGEISVYHPVPIIDKSDARKFYAYGLGYGYLSSIFIKNGNFIVAAHLVKTLVRSLGGAAVFLFNKEKRAAYFGRFLGAIKGSSMAFLGTQGNIK